MEKIRQKDINYMEKYNRYLLPNNHNFRLLLIISRNYLFQ